MELELVTHIFGGFEKTTRLLNLKHILLTEYVATVCHLPETRKHLFYDEIHIFIRVSGIFLRHRMRPQKSGNDTNRLPVFVGQTPDGSEHLFFCLSVKPVAALCLNCGNTHRRHTVKEPLGAVDEFILRSGSCGIDSALDTSSTLHDRHIRVAFETPLEFVWTEAAENQVRMAVNESRQQSTSLGINKGNITFILLVFSHQVLCIGSRAYIFYQSVAHYHAPVFDGSEPGHRIPLAG